MQVLVTGGLGFIGSHVCVELLKQNYDVIVLDNLSNSKIEIKDKIEKLGEKSIIFYEGDIRDPLIMNQIFNDNKIDAVLHFAALKSVKESNLKEKLYNDVNINGTMYLLEIMNNHNCKKIIFSSSATVYGENKYPVDENSQTGSGLSCVYATNKYYMEDKLKQLYEKDNTWSITILRYFNPIGAHKSGELGEDPLGIPNNIFPYLLKVAKGDLEEFTVFGNTYDTPDGTCLRDYIHVMDLADAHIVALNELMKDLFGSLSIYNVGTGKPTSVLELVKTLSKYSNKQIKYKIGDKRDGDLPCVYAKVDKIKNKLNWSAKYNIDDMCKDGLKYIYNI